MKSESDIEIINMKATVMLAFGFVAISCPVNELTLKLEATIMRFLLPYFESSKVCHHFLSVTSASVPVLQVRRRG